MHKSAVLLRVGRSFLLLSHHWLIGINDLTMTIERKWLRSTPKIGGCTSSSSLFCSCDCRCFFVAVSRCLLFVGSPGSLLLLYDNVVCGVWCVVKGNANRKCRWCKVDEESVVHLFSQCRVRFVKDLMRYPVSGVSRRMSSYTGILATAADTTRCENRKNHSDFLFAKSSEGTLLIRHSPVSN